MRWRYRPVDEKKVLALGGRLGLSAITTSLLVRMGITEPEAGQRFLNPKLQYLEDPFRIANMEKAVARLLQAMNQAESIVVFGDYDVDGVTSTAFLLSVLNVFSIYPRYVVPLRKDEGYGLSMPTINRALEEGPFDLLIAVDCGTNSNKEVEYLRQRGIDVIILDHHTSKENVPGNCIVVNPHVFNAQTEPWNDLCTVGLVFKFAHGLIKKLREEQDEAANQIDLRDYLDLVALGTISDLVTLRDENRILAKAGLERLKNTRRLGLSALFEVCHMNLGEEVTPYDIGFRLGPRINASGRLADASQPIEMLLSENREKCLQAAQLLDNFNRERQDIERQILIEAEALIAKEKRRDACLVLFDPAWHPGVVGIVASRLAMKYYRPCIVLGSEDNVAKGSGRSIPEINLVEALQECTDLLAHWGGHPMAVGISLPPQNIDALRQKFHESILKVVGGKMPEPELEIHRWINPSEITEALLTELEKMHPFGQGNPEPVFGLRKVALSQNPRLFGHGHYSFQIPASEGRNLSGVAWKQAETLPPVDEPIDMAVKLGWNNFNNRQYVQLQLVEWSQSV